MAECKYLLPPGIDLGGLSKSLTKGETTEAFESE